MTIKRIVECIDKTNRFITSFTMWLILPLIGIMLFEVVMRYAFHSPTVWGAELSSMIFGIYMIYSGPCSVYEKVQVVVDLFYSKLKPRTQAAVNFLTNVFTMAFFVSIISLTFKYAMESWELKEVSTSAWGQPIYHWKALIPIAYVLTFAQTVSDFIRNAYLAITGEEL